MRSLDTLRYSQHELSRIAAARQYWLAAAVFSMMAACGRGDPAAPFMSELRRLNMPDRVDSVRLSLSATHATCCSVDSTTAPDERVVAFSVQVAARAARQPNSDA